MAWVRNYFMELDMGDLINISSTKVREVLTRALTVSQEILYPIKTTDGSKCIWYR